MTSRELQIFMTVVECGKMSEAARKLYITQSSVSQAIASIEREYDILLFERLSNSLYLTADGEKLADYGRNFFAVKNNIEEFLSSASRHHRLKVGATVTVGTCVISPILKRVKEQLPGIEFDVSVANTHILEEKLLRNEIDVGLVEGRIMSCDLVSEPVMEDSMVLIFSPDHPFSTREKVDATELSGEPFILREHGSGTRALFEDQMRDKHISLDVKWSCYNSEAIKSAVMDGHGVSVISRRLVEKELQEGKLRCCDISGVELSRQFSIVYHKNKYFSEELRTFMSQCESFAKDEKTNI